MRRLILAEVSAEGGRGSGVVISAGRVLGGALISWAGGAVTGTCWVVGGGEWDWSCLEACDAAEVEKSWRLDTVRWEHNGLVEGR